MERTGRYGAADGTDMDDVWMTAAGRVAIFAFCRYNYLQIADEGASHFQKEGL